MLLYNRLRLSWYLGPILKCKRLYSSPSRHAFIKLLSYTNSWKTFPTFLLSTVDINIYQVRAKLHFPQIGATLLLLEPFHPFTEPAWSPSPFLFPLKLFLSPPWSPHPSDPPIPEVKPYSGINLAAVWPNVHWHTSLHLSHDVYLPFGSSLPGGLLYGQMEGFNLYVETMTSYWHCFTTLTWRFVFVANDR